MTIVRWDSLRDMAAHQERMSRMFDGFYGRPQEDSPAAHGCRRSTFTATASTSWC